MQPKSLPLRFRERVNSVMGESLLDSPCVKDCKILGFISANGREYLPDAMIKAIPLYENAFGYFDHAPLDATEARPFIEKFGRFKSVRFVEGDGLRGNFHYNPKHVYAETFRGWLESDPGAIGFSHTAEGKYRMREDGVAIIEEITKVESVDIVSSPASTGGLFESLKLTRETMNPLPVPAPAVAQETPVAPVPATPDPATPKTWKQSLGETLTSLLADETLTPEDCKAKIEAALKVLVGGKGGDEEGDDGKESLPFGKDEKDEEPKDEEEAYEAVKKHPRKVALYLLKKLDENKVKLATYEAQEATAKLETEAKKLCSTLGLTPAQVTPVFLGTLVSAKTPEAMTVLIQDRKTALGVKGPVSIAPTPNTNPNDPNAKKPTVQDFLSAVYGNPK